MRDSSQNIYLIFLELMSDFFEKSVSSLKMLLYKKPLSKDGILFSWIHHIWHLGPKKFYEKPTGIGIGKACFTPLAFLISHKRNPPQDVSKK